MKFGIAIFVVATIGLTGCSSAPQKTVRDDVALPIAKRYACLACHSVDKKVVGPSFKKIAAKYRGQKAQQRLFAKVRSGGAGAWGSMPAPPMRNIPDADLQTLIQWITELQE